MANPIEHITIKIWTGNDAFEESPTGEIARLLREIADRFERDGIPPHYIFDINGNNCGEISVLREDD